MAAPKGHQFWKLSSRHGRKKLFSTPELLWEAACEYFQWCDDNPLQEDTIQKRKVDNQSEAIEHHTVNKMRPYTMQGLALYLNCSVEYLKNFEQNNKDANIFMPIITRIRETVYNQKFTGAASGFFSTNIIARDLGLSDKREYNIEASKKTIDDLFPPEDE